MQSPRRSDSIPIPPPPPASACPAAAAAAAASAPPRPAAGLAALSPGLSSPRSPFRHPSLPALSLNALVTSTSSASSTASYPPVDTPRSPFAALVADAPWASASSLPPLALSPRPRPAPAATASASASATLLSPVAGHAGCGREPAAGAAPRAEGAADADAAAGPRQKKTHMQRVARATREFRDAWIVPE